MRASRDELLLLTSSLRCRVQFHGITSVGCKGSMAVAPQKQVEPATAVREKEVTPAERIEALRRELGDCRACPLGTTRIKLAYGVGNPTARVMLVGEGPGYMEDRQGEPFVGPAGQLLDKILGSIGLSRQPIEPSCRWVYIANIVKCRPMIDPAHPDKRGNDRPPSPEEMEKCLPFLLRQMRLIRPEFLVALGGTAAKALLNTTRGITSLRGRWVDYAVPGPHGFTVSLLPTFHPSALLRNPALKKDAWTDIKSLRAKMEEAGYSLVDAKVSSQ